MRTLFASAAIALAFAVAPAHAYTYIGGATPCETDYVSPTASSCYGFYEGNVLDGSADGLAAQANALSNLGYVGPAVNLTNWTNIFEPTKIQTPTGPNDDQYFFSTPLYGETIIGIHFGNGATYDSEKIFGKGNKGGGTAFFKFDNANISNGLITALINGGSSAVLYKTGTSPVPEPATWGMMLLGFGAMGATMRRAKVKKISFA